MKCPSCGRENPEDVNYCFYCAHSFRELGADSEDTVKAETDFADVNKQAAGMSGVFTYHKSDAAESVPERAAGDNTSMKAWQWGLYFLLLMSPYTWIIWLILTITWTMSENGSAERKSFAKGVLCFLGIVMAISMIASIYLVATMGVDGAISYLTNGVATSADALMSQSGMK